MLNKKSMGLHWFMLLIGAFIAIGTILYSATQDNLPEVGEYSFYMLRTFEKNSRVPVIIEDIAEGINQNTLDDFDNNKVFGLRSDCDPDHNYIDKIKETFEDVNGKLGIEGKTRNCIIDEDDFMELFGESFEKRLSDFGNINLEFSNAEYTSSVENGEWGYVNIVNAEVEIPFIIDKIKNEKLIGKFNMSSNFELPVDYTFDEAGEVCILSADCGADCNDVKAKYGEVYKIRDYSCNEYFSCSNAPADDFGKSYPCQGNFCEGECPKCECTDWVPGECSGDKRQFTRECRHDTCELPESDSSYDPCCADPICCEEYTYACDCSGYECCKENENLCSSEEGNGVGGPPGILI